MANFQNQPSNTGTSGATKTTSYFNNYFTPSNGISQQVNESILSFFETQTGDLDSAKLLVQAVIDTAAAQREDPLVVLSTFQNLPAGELTALLCLYLNTSRVNTSFLGVKNKVAPNQYVSRLIVK